MSSLKGAAGSLRGSVNSRGSKGRGSQGSNGRGSQSSNGRRSSKGSAGNGNGSRSRGPSLDGDLKAAFDLDEKVLAKKKKSELLDLLKKAKAGCSTANVGSSSNRNSTANPDTSNNSKDKNSNSMNKGGDNHGKDLKEVFKLRIKLAKLNNFKGKKDKKGKKKKDRKKSNSSDGMGSSDEGSDSSGDAAGSVHSASGSGGSDSSSSESDSSSSSRKKKKKKKNKKLKKGSESEKEDDAPRYREMVNRERQGWRSFYKTGGGKARYDRIERHEEKLVRAFHETRQSWEKTWHQGVGSPALAIFYALNYDRKLGETQQTLSAKQKEAMEKSELEAWNSITRRQMEFRQDVI